MATEASCFRCGYKWPSWAVQRENLQNEAEEALASGDLTDVNGCSECSEAPMVGGLITCNRCNNWLFSGLPVSL